ncbi:PQQ-binding-like beta-propeller repeat protein [bacterium]|nr:PQQ-binding-like beta-propeller repeat protein [bacterium]
MFSVNSGDGSINWSYDLNTPYSTHLVPSISSDGTVYTSSREYDQGTYTYYLCAFNSDGTIKWKFETGKSRANAPLVDQDDTIYFGTNYSLYAVNPDGTLKWEYKGEDPDIPQGFLPRIIDGNGVIYALSNLALYAINPDGTLKWTFEIPYDQESSLAMGADGTLYIGNSDNYLCAIGDIATPKVDIYTNGNSFNSGDTANISVKVDNPFDDPVDMYAAVMLNGILFWYPVWDETPHSTEIEKGVWDKVIASFSITSDIPAGPYNFYAAITEHNTSDVIRFDMVTINVNK